MQRMLRKIFEGEMLLKKQQTHLIQIFRKNIFESQVITKSIIDPDDTYVILQSRSYYTQLKTVWRLWRYLLMQRMLRKIFEGEMLLRKLQTTLLHLFYKTIFESQVIAKSIMDPGNNFRGTLNPSNTNTTFVQRIRTQRFLKTIQTLSCWYSLDSSRWELSDEYPWARISVVVHCFLHHFLLDKFATSSIRVKENIWRRNVKQNITNNTPSNFCKIILNSQVIIKSTKDPDENFKSSS